MKFSEKLRLLRKTKNLTQAELGAAVGVSRGNIANLELGNVKPTPLFVNCISLTFDVDKHWLLDDTDDTLNGLNPPNDTLLPLIIEKYGQLDDSYKKFVENQINQLLKLQQDNQ